MSIHEIFTKLHRVCNRAILLGTVALCALIVFLMMEKEAPPLEKNHSFGMLQEDFLRAVRAYDIKSAKRLYAHLQERNPYAPFVEEAAPAYLADIYLYYADKMSFNPQAAEVFLAQARRLAPNHPLLAPCPQCNTPEYAEKTAALLAKVSETEKIVAQETQAYVQELTVLEQTIEAMEVARVREEAARLSTMIAQVDVLPEPHAAQAPIDEIDVGLVEPPAPGVMPLLPQDDAPIITAAPPVIPTAPERHVSTEDACLLSYYTRNTPVSTCMDVVSDNQYGPALFVVGDDDDVPLAFTQQPITVEAYNALCQQTNTCTPDVKKGTHVVGFDLDLSDVENTVQHYNAFCQMSQNCSSIVSNTAPVFIEKDKLSAYAKSLSQETGYRYHVMTSDDVNVITDYFNTCVAKGQCEEALSDELANFLKTQQGVLLVRNMQE